jgi:hypothetical protein
MVRVLQRHVRKRDRVVSGKCAVYAHVHPVLKLKMSGTIPPFPPYIFMSRCLIKHPRQLCFWFIPQWISSYTSEGGTAPNQITYLFL